MTESRVNSYALMQSRQADWANHCRVRLERPGYATSLTDNLFLGQLNNLTEREFDDADGSELRNSGLRPAKMRALISSSALAVNFFDPWRNVSKSALQLALGLDQAILDLRFEYKCQKYPVPPRSPNLDLFLTVGDGQKVGVECKFLEPYRDPGVDSPLSLRYYPSGDGFWSRRGLRHTQRLVDSMRGQWDFLDAPQLLKHILGLGHDSPDQPVRLMYIWFNTGRPDAERHRTEIQRFENVVRGDDVHFDAISYQELFARLVMKASEPAQGWTTYMTNRYFATTKPP